MEDTHEWLYRVQPTRPGMLTEGPTEDEQRIVGEHFEYLSGLLQRGSLVLAGRTLTTDERTFGLAIFHAPNEQEARAIVDADPAVRAGVMRAELFPYRIALLHGRD
jgi:uncharacterized protein YciI